MRRGTSASEKRLDAPLADGAGCELVGPLTIELAHKMPIFIGYWSIRISHIYRLLVNSNIAVTPKVTPAIPAWVSGKKWPRLCPSVTASLPLLAEEAHELLEFKLIVAKG